MLNASSMDRQERADEDIRRGGEGLEDRKLVCSCCWGPFTHTHAGQSSGSGPELSISPTEGGEPIARSISFTTLLAVIETERSTT